ncbi:MAG: hypothetical protein AMS17_07190 [Spirochaetes bacterium DG_61]|jgi:hypothetical protein|nr:MAG: hypothetical protein AMS17_07190 [Spirochaetes bacterium DG_61]
MLKRYKIYHYFDRNREIKIATEINDNGEWVKYKECKDRVQALADDNIAMQNRVAMLEKKNRLLTDTLRWYADVANWLPSAENQNNMLSDVESDQGKRAQESLLEFGIEVDED